MQIDRRTLLSAGAMCAAFGPGAALAKGKGHKRLEIGKPVPFFNMRAADKRKYSLKDFVYPGKDRARRPRSPLLLDFFRTDCEPCLRSMPELVKLHETYGKLGLQVVLVALYEQVDGRGKLTRYLDKSKLPFLVLHDPADYTAEKYLGKTVSLPATFLIDREGVLVHSKYDAKKTMQEAFDAKIQALIAKEPKR